MKRIHAAVGLVFLTLLAAEVLAQGPPIHTDTPIMLGLQGRGVRTFVKYVYLGKAPNLGVEDDVTMIPRLRVRITPVVIPYNLFSDRFQLGVILPLTRIRRTEIAKQRLSSGMGDVRLFVKYLLLQWDRRQETLRLAAKSTVKLAAGATDAVPALGSGSTDVLLSAVAGWIKKRVGLYAEGIYQFSGTFGQLAYGDKKSVNLALGYRLFPAVYRRYPSPQLNGFLEINATFTQRSRLNGAEIHNTGGTLVLISPGLQYVGGRRWLVEASWQWPMVHRPNGLQPVMSWQFLLGTRILLF
ncbi:MAG: transporter [candidate division KSB1 bacterium]|nr:transporter [candidate division KSB1 bacterium]